MLLLEQDTIRKKRINKKNATKLDAGNKNSNEYKINAI